MSKQPFNFLAASALIAALAVATAFATAKTSPEVIEVASADSSSPAR